MKVSFLLFISLGLSLFGQTAVAGQIQYCYPVKKERTLQDPGSHPNAYDDGYREGVAEAKQGKPFSTRTAGGEFSRGYEEGYRGQPYSGQRNTIPDRIDTYSQNQCRTYYYNDSDPIQQSLKRVLDNFQDDFRRDWQLR